MRTLHVLGRLVDFVVGSFVWAAVIVLAAATAPFALVGFFLWQIFYNTDRFFHLWLPFTPTAIWMMLTDSDPVGRILIGIPLAIIGWTLLMMALRAYVRHYLRREGYSEEFIARLD